MSPILFSPLLQSIPNLSHGFTTREGGASSPPFDSLNLGWGIGDEEDRVEENHGRLATALGFPPDQIFGVSQVHGDHSARIDREDFPSQVRSQTADALISDRTGILLTVRTADCCPVLVVDPVRQIVAAIHAGWRGTLARIVPKTVDRLRIEFGSSPENLRVAVGPTISAGHYAVSEAIASDFARELDIASPLVVWVDRSPHLDLAATNVELARRCGVPSAQIWSAQICTFKNRDRFFSYRRDGKSTGRCVGAVGWHP